MSVPDYQKLMQPLLEAVADGNEHVLRDVTQQLSDRFGLTDEDRKRLIPSGQQPVISNRVAWARTYLKKAGLVASTGRGRIRITDEGLTTC